MGTQPEEGAQGCAALKIHFLCLSCYLRHKSVHKILILKEMQHFASKIKRFQIIWKFLAPKAQILLQFLLKKLVILVKYHFSSPCLLIKIYPQDPTFMAIYQLKGPKI